MNKEQKYNNQRSEQHPVELTWHINESLRAGEQPMEPVELKWSIFFFFATSTLILLLPEVTDGLKFSAPLRLFPSNHSCKPSVLNLSPSCVP